MTATMPSMREVVWPYMDICERVISTPACSEDTKDARRFHSWLRAHRTLPTPIGKIFLSPRPRSIRCKWCGRYTPYIAPNEGVAYFDNRCRLCKRGYPAPSMLWDCVNGQAYMFYRRSVTDAAFYQYFLGTFDVRELNDERFSGKPAI
jgi:hypothetical protein